ncbi:hypothetical protein OQ279_02805 [Salinimicrobium sp. MT39]|uniref:DUF3575 domain-containing protein n=1 Tax=Salinimicrobium profundisediminis TaxID=2994553 RepID=A0A9X3CUK7_9FLAO|nr:hypothetical protein [Salinimicrobium profundisediminis]MCX2837072.1 hypothetical protein [Salinimicrobium profundisediminis]
MKKTNILTFLTLLLLATPVVAQQGAFSQASGDIEIDSAIQEENIFKRDSTYSEVHLNVLNLLVFGALDVGYERIINDHASAGVEIFSKVFNKNEGEDVDLSKIYTKDFSITGKFKYFLQEENTAWGYYAEAFGMFSNGDNEVKRKFPNSETGELEEKEVFIEYTDIAIGIGVGGKFVAKQGFLVDLSFGIGRNLFDKNSPDIVLLPTVNVGYRF